MKDAAAYKEATRIALLYLERELGFWTTCKHGDFCQCAQRFALASDAVATIEEILGDVKTE